MFTDINKPINFCPIGKCNLAHCFNGHSFIALAGNVPDLKLSIPTYAAERDRICTGGGHWLTETCRDFFSKKASDLNPVLSVEEKKKIIKKNKRLHSFRLLNEKFRGLKRHLRRK